MRIYRASPEIESNVALRGSQLVDPGVLAITYKTFPAELLTEASGRIGAGEPRECSRLLAKQFRQLW